MNLSQFEHGIRTACRLLNTQAIYIVGSQSILASYPNLSGPISKSMELDVLPVFAGGQNASYEEQQHAADIICGSAGEGSLFAIEHQFELEGVVESDLILPRGWQERTVDYTSANTQGFVGRCLDPYDMATAKVAAGRDKDRVAVSNLIRQGVLKPRMLKQRVEELTDDQLFDGSSVKDLVLRLERWCKIAIPPKVPPGHKPPTQNDTPGM